MMDIWRSDYTMDVAEFKPTFGASATCTHLALEEAVGARKGHVSDRTLAAQRWFGSLASYASVSLKMIERDAICFEQEKVWCNVL